MQPQPEQPILKFSKSPGHVRIYANAISVRSTLWDMVLGLGISTPVAPQFPNSPQELLIEEQAELFISPQQAKALVQILLHNVQAYEQNFGPINIQSSQNMLAQLVGNSTPQ